MLCVFNWLCLWNVSSYSTNHLGFQAKFGGFSQACRNRSLQHRGTSSRCSGEHGSQMKRGRDIVAAVLAAIVVAGVVIDWLDSRELAHQGRRLGGWLQEVGSSNAATGNGGGFGS